MLIFLVSLSVALADDCTPMPGVQGDVFATANTALAKAEEATANVKTLRARVYKLERAGSGATGGDIAAAKQELKAAVQVQLNAADAAAHAALEAQHDAEAAAGRAKAAADRAEAAGHDGGTTTVDTSHVEELTRRAEAAAVRAEAALEALQALQALPQRDDDRDDDEEAWDDDDDQGGNADSHEGQSMNSPPPPDRDQGSHDPRFFLGFGGGPSWMLRNPQWEASASGIITPDIDETASGMLGGFVEIGGRNFGSDGRLDFGLRGYADYNIGGGYSLVGETFFGGFIDRGHFFRLEGGAGVGWETIPALVGDDYAERRWSVSLAAEVVPSEHWGIMFVAQGMPDNDVGFDGSNAAQFAAYLHWRL